MAKNEEERRKLEIRSRQICELLHFYEFQSVMGVAGIFVWVALKLQPKLYK